MNAKDKLFNLIEDGIISWKEVVKAIDEDTAAWILNINDVEDLNESSEDYLANHRQPLKLKQKTIDFYQSKGYTFDGYCAYCGKPLEKPSSNWRVVTDEDGSRFIVCGDPCVEAFMQEQSNYDDPDYDYYDDDEY